MQTARYTVFQRSAVDWESFATARKMTIRRNLSLAEAQRMCDDFNNNRTPAQVKRGTKYEFISQ